MDTQRAHLMDTFCQAWLPTRQRSGSVRTAEASQRHDQGPLGSRPAACVRSPDRLLKQMKVSLLFKGVTCELPTNTDFLRACAKAGLDMNQMHENARQLERKASEQSMLRI